MFGFLSIVNNTILAYFWAYAGIPGVDGISPFGDEQEMVSFDVSAPIGYTYCILFILIGTLELLLIKPAYDKLCWNTFQEIGSDMHIQTCYRNFEVAKGSWNLLFWFSGVEMSTVFFFEDNAKRRIVLFIIYACYAVGLVFGYFAVR